MSKWPRWNAACSKHSARTSTDTIARVLLPDGANVNRTLVQGLRRVMRNLKSWRRKRERTRRLWAELNRQAHVGSDLIDNVSIRVL